MADAAEEIRSLKGVDENEVADCAVSCDGTWQRREISSLNGCVTIMSIDTGKVLDAEAMSRSCKQCQLQSHLEGAQRMFTRSEEIHKLRYS